jgi:peptidoglycan/LPS O-acetylase OafA/YrhL
MSATVPAPTDSAPPAATGAVRVTQSLGEALKGHSNALGLLRLVLASVVIFDHAFPLGGFGTDPIWKLTHQQASLGSIAVAGFFAISGYLIAKSGMTADVLQFLWRRVLRIFPAYWGVLLFTALILAPIIWLIMGRGLGDYFTLAYDGPFHYFTRNWTLNIGTYGIYDIFATTTPYGRSVGDASVFNGSTWTLIYEFTCYLIIAVGVAFGVLVRARIVVPILTGLLFILQIVYLVHPETVASILPFFADQYRLNLTLTFLFGSCLAVYSKSIPFDDRLGVLAGIVMLLTLHYGGFTLVGLPAGAYFVMYLGARIGGPLRRVGAKNDYSYGVYVYGFVVQQTLAYFGVYRLGYVPFVLIALVVSLGFAWLSWHGIEKHAMALKDWGPGRGWRHWFDRVRSFRSRRDRAEVPSPAKD